MLYQTLLDDLSLKNETSPFQQLMRWYSQFPGAKLKASEVNQLARVLPQMFGYYLLQCGDMTLSEGLEASPILKHVGLHQSQGNYEKAPLVRAEYAGLPIKSDSIDVALLYHVLEFEKDPQAILEEAWRVLIPDGYLVILGFNPISLWGLRRLFMRSQGKRPWNGKFRTAGKINRYLSEMGCELVEKSSFFFRPPLQNEDILKKLRFLEIVGKVCWPTCGAVYMIVARKKLVTLTPLRPNWRSLRVGIRHMVQPTVRRVSRE